MYVVAVIVFAVYGIGFFKSGKEVIDWQAESVMKPFYRLALYLFKKRCGGKRKYRHKGQVKRDLELLHPGEAGEQVYTTYYVKKTGLSLLVCFVGTVLGLIISVKSAMGVLLADDGTIPRTNFREGNREILLEATLDKECKQTFEVVVESLELSDEEFESVMREFRERLKELILNGNASLQEVTSDLNLADSFSEYPFVLEWKSDRPDILGSSGKVWEVSEEQQVMLRVKISYGDRCLEEVLEVCVVPENLTEQEQQYRRLREYLLSSEAESRRDAVWKLPETYDGKKLLWKQSVENYGLLLWGLAIVVSVAVFLLSDRDLHSLLLKRRACMKREYPDVVHTLVLYLGAGMTIRGAFWRMSCDKEGQGLTPVYEEIRYTCRELQAGVSEGLAYEHFGKRTGLQEYVRLCTLLTQNLKKGNAALLSRLKEEAAKASTERMQTVKKLSEEAGTKLLVPMVMMLGAVMLMIMIPAFSAMGM